MDASTPRTAVPHPLEEMSKRWRTDDPRRLVGRGHPIGDFLEAFNWDVLEEREGYLKLACHLPQQVRNPRGDLFGGFTPTYADFAAVFTVRAGRRQEPPRSWIMTASLAMDYFRPVTGEFVIESEVLHRSGRTFHVQLRFLDGKDRLLATGKATMIETATVGEG